MNNSTPDSSATIADTAARPLCLALIWLKGSTGAAERTRIRDAIMNRPGVASIETSSRHSSVLMVRFDRESTCASGLVGWLRKSGLPGVLVGC